MSIAAGANPAFDPIFERLEEQIGWYDARSRSNMRWYKRLKLSEIGSAAKNMVLVELYTDGTDAASQVNQKLEELMLRSFYQVRKLAKERNLRMRTAALSLGVQKVANEKQRRGLYP